MIWAPPSSRQEDSRGWREPRGIGYVLIGRKAAAIRNLPFLRSLVKLSGLTSEGNGSVALTDIFRLSPTRFDPNPAPARLVAEPAPADATFERGTLVLVHGNYWKDAI